MSNLNIPGSWRYQQGFQNRPNPIVNLDTVPQLIRLSETTSFHRITYTGPSLSNPAQLVFRVQGNVWETQVFTISNQVYSQTYTGSSTPTFNQFFTVTGDTSFLMRQRVAESIAYELQNHPLFGNDYEIYSESDFVYVTSKQNSPQYNLTVVLPMNCVVVSNTNSTIQYHFQNLVDYSTFVNLHVGNWTYGQSVDRFNSTLVDQLNLPASPPNLPFDVSSSLRDSVDVVLPNKLPIQNFIPYQLDKVSTKRILVPYFTLYGDSFRYSIGGQKKQSTVGVSPILWIQNGSRNLLESYNLTPYTTASTLSNSVRFLTDKPSTKWTTRTSQEFVQFIISEVTNNTTCGLEVNVRFLDGTDVTYQMGNTSAVGLGGNISIDVSHDIVGVPVQESIANKEAYSYRVRFWHQRQSFPKVFSEWSEYKFQDKCHKPSINIIWFNKFGAWDSYEFVKEFETSEFSQNSFERNVEFPFNVSNEIELVHAKTINNKVNVSAVLDKEHYTYMKGLIESTAIFYYDNNLKRYIQLILTNTDYSTDFSSTTELQLEFRLQNTPTISR